MPVTRRAQKGASVIILVVTTARKPISFDLLFFFDGIIIRFFFVTYWTSRQENWTLNLCTDARCW